MNHDVLCHYGIKGQKWGVRRYQNQDGTLTTSGKIRYKSAERSRKAARTKDDVDAILETLTEKERNYLNLDRSTSADIGYLSIEEGEHVAKRILLKEGKKPIAFFDLIDTGNNLDVAVGTRNDPNYRGKGYASEAVKCGLAWYEKNKNRIGNRPIQWEVKKDNIQSRKLAEKNGFVLDQTYTDNQDEWARYIRR